MKPSVLPRLLLAVLFTAQSVHAVIVTATYNTATDVPVTATSYTATGNTVDFTLNYAPTTGTSLTVVKNTGLSPIVGTFGNLAQGQIVALSQGGVTYNFVANYHGGTGNDLVLQWATSRTLAWGLNDYGQLGNNTLADSSVPVAVNTAGVLSGKTVIAVSAGYHHSVALCSDGTLAAWGLNDYGQLGDGSSTTQSTVPVAVNTAGVLSGKTVTAVSAGYYHSVALCSDGTLVAWGFNYDGQLGNNNTTDSPVPVAVNTAGVLSGKTVIAVSAGLTHSLALCSDGTLAAWGSNFAGQLGNNSTTQSSVPVAVNTAGVLSGKTVIALCAGSSHSLALCSDGTLAAWGSNFDGQLGNNSTTNSSVPVAVNTAGVLSGKTVTAVSAGYYHSLALCSDGALAAWGSDFSGQLGDASTTQSSVPVAVYAAGVLSGKTVIAVSAGTDHSLALCSDGTLAAWGDNYVGQLGDASTTNSSVPVAVNTASLASGERFMVGVAGSTAFHILSIAASPPPPTVTTLAATSVTGTGATLNGTVNAHGGSIAVTFDFGTGVSYGTSVPGTPTPVTGSSAAAVSAALTGLTPGTTYHFRANGVSGVGTTHGNDLTFTTLSNNANLSSLALSIGTLTPAFASGTTDYTASVSNAVDFITVTPTVADSNATVKVNEVAVTSGNASGSISLSVGENTITTEVAAQDGVTTQDYIVVLTRESAIQSWRQMHFGTTSNTGNAQDNADPNYNGISNLFEYALDGDPIGNTSGTSILPQASRSGTNCLQLTFTRYLDRNDITMIVQANDALTGTWTDLAQSVNGGAFIVLAPGATAGETGTGNTRLVTAGDLYQVTDPAHPRRFMRLQVTSP